MTRKSLPIWICGLVFSLYVLGASDLRYAEELYNRTQYRESLSLLANGVTDAAGWNLTGRDWFMLGDFKKAAEAFQKSLDLQPDSSNYALWLGRAYGRRAESGNFLAAPGYAAKARQFMERAVALDPDNKEALDDLFDYYLEAPGFLGGGFDKASQLAQRIGEIDPAEYQFAQAALAEKRKEYHTVEEHLRRAIELAPRQVGRVLDLAKYLARQGRVQESDAVFQQAEKLAPNSPKVLFAKAKTYVETKRNLDEAENLLKRYLQSNLTPDDPPREAAEKLLKQAKGA
jgi:tetratricopeptide (TPR) repeat protein